MTYFLSLRANDLYERSNLLSLQGGQLEVYAARPVSRTPRVCGNLRLFSWRLLRHFIPRNDIFFVVASECSV
jgi:hypothetical protein